VWYDGPISKWVDSYWHISAFRLYSAIHVGSRWKIKDKRQIKRQTIFELKTTQKKQTMQNTAKQNYLGSVASYDTRQGNKVGIFYLAPKPTQGKAITTSYLSFLVINNLTCHFGQYWNVTKRETNKWSSSNSI